MAEARTVSRIWYQSFVDPQAQAPYITRLQAMLDHVAAPGTRFEVHGLTPPDRFFGPLTEFRCAIQTVRHAIDAERNGYDAFVIGHFQEPGLLECRTTLDVPVIGLGEAALLTACTLGRKIGLVTIDPVFIPWHEDQVVRHGLERRIAGVRAIRADLDLFMRAFENEDAYRKVRTQFEEQVRPLVADGAEVILPAGGRRCCCSRASEALRSTGRRCSTASPPLPRQPKPHWASNA
ncbi:MAG TPA: aspartate/glutamate racemase family protein [Geminicoccus sp.]|uniref:aspartate/glutamate racemase family protein n=1 Tax=Geminicoccus sp. TaxID=2024832 RepID=UPI002E35AD8E|nr:aspartate/glutamate racemase family protein [Geminicoccus sp.]HEX2527095.1 aspartate/glutamate racemase family protein [Geminicoccus sp.]